MVTSSLFLLFVILFMFSIFLFIATMSFAGYFLVRSLLSGFPSNLRTYSRFDWFGPVYLVTTAGFVADQLMCDKKQTSTTPPPKRRRVVPRTDDFFDVHLLVKGVYYHHNNVSRCCCC